MKKSVAWGRFPTLKLGENSWRSKHIAEEVLQETKEGIDRLIGA